MSTLRSLSTFGGGNLSSISSLSTWSTSGIMGGATGGKMLIAYVAVVLVLLCTDDDLERLKAAPGDAKEWKNVLLGNEKVQLAIALAVTMVVCSKGACAFSVEGVSVNLQGAMLGALVGAVGCCCDKGDAVKNACGMTKDHMMALGALVGALCC
jgi:hypothetical protein